MTSPRTPDPGVPGHDDRYHTARFLARAARLGPMSDMYRDPNIVGAAYGRRVAGGVRTDEPALVVYVAHKVPARFLPTTAMLPRGLYLGQDYLALDVVETGPFHLHSPAGPRSAAAELASFTERERPAPYGVSIGHVDITAGTLGSLVRACGDASLHLLSNNHVLANLDNAAVGDPIVQPGPFDGGRAPADTIAKLTRFVPLCPTGNVADAAIAAVTDEARVADRVKDDLVPVASADHPAVGLLFAGSANRTLLNPIDLVLARLDVALPAGAGATAAVDLDSRVEKVGRTTRYTTSTVTEVDVSVTVAAGPGRSFGFDGQIATGALSEPGDSGSVVYLGGAGGRASSA